MPWLMVTGCSAIGDAGTRLSGAGGWMTWGICPMRSEWQTGSGTGFAIHEPGGRTSSQSPGGGKK